MSGSSNQQWHAPMRYATSADLLAASAYSLRMGWPGQDHMPLLVAACAPRDRAVLAWRQWRAGLSAATLSNIGLSAARLLAQVSIRLRSFGVRDAVLDRTLSMYRHTWLTNQLRLRSALSAVRTLDDAGIRALALKGLALLASAYPDVGLRPMFDVDLLVHPEDKDGAFHALLRAGWHSLHPRIASSRCADPLLWPNSVTLQEDRFELDLHWHALRQDACEALDHELWTHSVVRPLDGTPLLCPHSTELLLVVCLHGMVWTRTQHTLWPVDAHRLITTAEPVDWKRLIATATTRRLALPLYDALLFLRSVLETDVPQAVLTELAATPISEVECMEHAAATRDFAAADYRERSAMRELMRLRAENDLARCIGTEKRPLTLGGESITHAPAREWNATQPEDGTE